MEELAMCRICLAEDVQLRLIANTPLQEMYESLTLLPLETKDSRPIQACYICCAELQNCNRLRKRCLRSEELFMQKLRSAMVIPINIKEDARRLRVEHVIHLSIGNVLQNKTDDDTTEDKANNASTTIVVDHNMLKHEDTKVLEDIKIEPQEEQDAQLNDLQYSYNPLHVMKKEPDGVETDPEDQKLGIEDITIEENEAISAYQSSLSANNKCSKIMKVEVEIMDINNTIVATGVPALKKLTETDSLLVPKTGNKSIVIEKHRHNKMTAHNKHRHTSSKHNLTQHIYTHTGNKPYIDEICKKKFSQSQLTFHLHTITGNKQFQCDTCNKCFTRKSYLSQHLTTHNAEKRFQCHTCNKCFTRKSYLTQHLTIHSAEKRFQCDTCNKCFTRQSILTQHLTIHTSAKRFQCDICHKCFTRKYILMQHLNLHTGEKLFQCDTCHKSFTRKRDLMRHRYTHTGEKLFQCDTCDKCFTSKPNLRKHQTTHTGKERFHCDACNECFTKNSDLTQHLYIHTLMRNGFTVPLATNASQENLT